VRADVAAEREHGREVDLQHLIPVGLRELVARVTALDPGAVHQDADVVAVLQCSWDEGGYFAWGAEVAGVDCGFTAESNDGVVGCGVGGVALRGISCEERDGLGGLEMMAYLDENEIGASFSQGDCHLLSDASSGTGDERGAAFE